MVRTRPAGGDGPPRVRRYSLLSEGRRLQVEESAPDGKGDGSPVRLVYDRMPDGPERQ